ncbi:hypothetical protein NIES2107_56050 [Nostoc carneum NIES-2107]|nr:hypothetical protein NIES2107_56050 [Nostoc carneum NIES-2107]
MMASLKERLRLDTGLPCFLLSTENNVKPIFGI